MTTMMINDWQILSHFNGMNRINARAHLAVARTKQAPASTKLGQRASLMRPSERARARARERLSKSLIEFERKLPDELRWAEIIQHQCRKRWKLPLASWDYKTEVEVEAQAQSQAHRSLGPLDSSSSHHLASRLLSYGLEQNAFWPQEKDKSKWIQQAFKLVLLTMMER